MAQTMTLLELQTIFGETVRKVRQEGLTPEERQTVNEQSALVMNIGKQMINNADMMLRYEKLQAQNANLVHSQLKEIVGY